MKFISLTFFFIYITGTAPAQEKKIITVNPVKENTKDLMTSVFYYPGFLDGKVIFKDSSVVDARMNYHRLFDQVLFIGPKNDTLALAHPETFNSVIIGIDTFYFFDKGYIRKISHYTNHNLALKQIIKYVGTEKQGPYGTYSPVSSSNSNSTVTTDDQITQYIRLDENQLYKISNEFYLSDGFNNFFKATKKNFYNLFSRYTTQIREFLSANSTNFAKQDDLEKLLAYVKSLQ